MNTIFTIFAVIVCGALLGTVAIIPNVLVMQFLGNIYPKKYDSDFYKDDKQLSLIYIASVVTGICGTTIFELMLIQMQRG